MIKKFGHVLLALAVIGVSLLALPSSAQADQGAPVYITYDPSTLPPVPKITGNGGPTKTVKSGHGVPPRGGSVSTLALPTGYHYAGTSELPASAQGYFQTNAWVAQPTCSGAGNHSLFEITMQAGSVSGLDRDNIVELGAACEPTAFGTTKLSLFASCWVNNVWQGSYTGGCGYLDSAAAINLGADLTATGLNHLNSVRKFAMQYQASGCGGVGGVNPGIFILYDTSWVGCFPTIGGANRLATTFTGGTFFQAFGETHKSGTTCLGMGNDLFPATTTTATSYFNTLSHAVPPAAANGVFTTTVATDPTVYGSLFLNNVARRYGGKEVGSPNC